MTKPEFWEIPVRLEHHTANPESGQHQQVALKLTQLTERLTAITQQHRVVKFATSLAAEDMVLTDAIASLGLPIEIFTLNTGRLHPTGVTMIDTVQAHYHLPMTVMTPIASEVESYIAQFGRNGFYDSQAAKKACCDVRKVQPLNLALRGCDAWLTGQRREQAVTRSELVLEEFDTERQMAKFNPLFDFTQEDIWAYLLVRQVPIHPLHHQGYPSIGCDPCTRPVKKGEDIRAGRWWWLLQESKECGLHISDETIQELQSKP